MAVRSTLPTHTAAKIREVLRGLPSATGYRVTVKPLRYRTAPHLQAFTYWGEPEMVLQVPEPFRPFSAPAWISHHSNVRTALSASEGGCGSGEKLGLCSKIPATSFERERVGRLIPAANGMR